MTSQSRAPKVTDLPVICSSMRKRSDWASLFPALLRSNNPGGRWKEAQLNTHDVALPLRLPGQPSHLAFCAICLSTQDVASSETRERLERLYNLNGGQYVAVVVLVNPADAHNGQEMMIRLQMELMGGREMPVLPIVRAEALSETIQTFQRQLLQTSASNKQPKAVRDLLPYCSDVHKLPEHTVNVLSDITTGLRDVVTKATTAEGQEFLQEYIGDDAKRLISFWHDEYAI